MKFWLHLLTLTASQYAPTVFAQAGIPFQTASFLASSASTILMLVFSIPATLFADKWGRRTSAICGGIILSGSMLLVGSLYAANAVHSYGAARWVFIVLIFVFSNGYIYLHIGCFWKDICIRNPAYKDSCNNKLGGNRW